MFPPFPDKDPLNPFDMWSGANFRLRIRQVDGYRNYESSDFDSSKPLFEDDEKIKEVFSKAYSLNELLDPKNFKSYDELKARLVKVLDEKTPTIPRAENKTLEEPTFKSYNEPTSMMEDDGDEDTDDSVQFFKKLAAK